jgi:hypothetical protein
MITDLSVNATVLNDTTSSIHTLKLPDGFIYFKYTILLLCTIFGLPGNVLTLVLCYRSLRRSKKRSSKTTSFFTNLFKLFQLKSSIDDSSIKSSVNAGSFVRHQQQKNNGDSTNKTTCMPKATKRTSYLEAVTTTNTKLGKLNGHQRKSFELYLIEISIFDILMLLYWFSDELVDILHAHTLIQLDTLINLSDFCCKFFLYINRVNGLMCMWLTFAITFIRCIVISKPLSVRYTFQLNKIKSNVVLFFALLVVCLCANLNVFFHFGFDKRGFVDANDNNIYVVREQCSPLVNSTTARYLHNYGLGIVGYSLPSLAILFMNLFIVYKILSSWYKLNHDFKTLLPDKVQQPRNGTKYLKYSSKTVERELVPLEQKQNRLTRHSSSLSLHDDNKNGENPSENAPTRTPDYLNIDRHSKFVMKGGRCQIKSRTSNPSSSNNNRYYDSFRSRMKRKHANMSIFNSLVAVSLTYIVFYLPYTLSFLLSEFANHQDILDISNIAYHYGFCLRYLSHSITFYCYILTGRRFRNDFLEIVGKLRLKISFVLQTVLYYLLYFLCCFACCNKKYKTKYAPKTPKPVKNPNCRLNSHTNSSSMDTVTAAALCAANMINKTQSNNRCDCGLLSACSLGCHQDQSKNRESQLN